MNMVTKDNIRTNHKARLKAFDLLIQLKSKNISRFEIITRVHHDFGVPIGSLYDWYRNKCLPHGRKGKIKFRPELFYALGALLGDQQYLETLLKQNDFQSKMLFIEGFFDAEGCVKIINDKMRKTPKICLDITNTNLGYLELLKYLMKDGLNIDSNYSVQESKTLNRKTAYHLRIYRKEHVKRFFENISTTKLKDKRTYLQNWLEKKERA